jgi:hypothetical protein
MRNGRFFTRSSPRRSGARVVRDVRRVTGGV